MSRPIDWVRRLFLNPRMPLTSCGTRMFPNFPCSACKLSHTAFRRVACHVQPARALHEGVVDLQGLQRSSHAEPVRRHEREESALLPQVHTPHALGHGLLLEQRHRALFRRLPQPVRSQPGSPRGAGMLFHSSRVFTLPSRPWRPRGVDRGREAMLSCRLSRWRNELSSTPPSTAPWIIDRTVAVTHSAPLLASHENRSGTLRPSRVVRPTRHASCAA